MLRLLRRLVRERLCFTRQIGLRLARAVGVGHLAATGLHDLLVADIADVADVAVGAGALLFAVLERVVAHVAAHVGLGAIVELRVLLTELFLRGSDQAIVVLGVLIIILGGHRVAR